MSRNCQSFAELFKELIQNRSLLTDEKHMEVQDLPDSFNPLFVILHLDQAKAVASGWTRRVLCKKGPTSPNEAATGHGRLPGKRSSRWLEIVNEQARQQEFHDTVDVRGIFQTANRLHREERSVPRPRRRWTLGT
jgi:hypothetical protein